MDEELLRRVVAGYGLSYRQTRTPQKGYRNTSFPVTLSAGEVVNFILYKNEPGILERIKRANLTADFLASNGLPVRRTISTKIAVLKTNEKTRYGAVYNYLQGHTIPWEAYTKAHIKLLGMAMSHMHASMQGVSGVDNSVVDEYIEIVQRMQAYFQRSDVQGALVDKLNLQVEVSFARMLGMLRLCKNLPNQQTLHMDFVRGNILFDAPKDGNRFFIGQVALSGILDFEKVAYGHPLFDIARTLAFLLVDCTNKTPAQIKNYFLRSGYDKRGKVRFSNVIVARNDTKIDILEEMITLFLTYDFYKFLRHNPYESLADNHHFVRTRNILIQRKVLQYI
jgi:Ser/Thr protein kinase RdoA (MazF antagonist)